jgi:hypothetical protein
MAMNKASLYFWKHMQRELETHGLSAGIAVLNYSESLLRLRSYKRLNVELI